MAKATVLRCDLCGAWDEPGKRVMTVPVAGPRFDLCVDDRIMLIASVGVDKLKAQAYVQAYDQRVTGDGTKLSLSGKQVTELAARMAAQVEEADPDQSAVPDDAAEAPPESPGADGGPVTDSGLAGDAGGAETGVELVEPAPEGGRRARRTRS